MIERVYLLIWKITAVTVIIIYQINDSYFKGFEENEKH